MDETVTPELLPSQSRTAENGSSGGERVAISVVIAIRNNWTQLAECLATLRTQKDAPSFEVIVVDDGSTTQPLGEALLILEQMKVRLFRQVGLGISAARNRAIRQARAELILIVDSDCLLEPSCLQNLVSAARHYVSDVAFQLSLSSPESDLVQRVESLRLGAVQASLLTASGHIQFINTSGFALRTAYAREVGDLFDVAVARGEDTLLLARLIRQNRLPRFLPACKVLHAPRVAFWKYARKQFRVGYLDQYSHARLRASGGVLLCGARRRKTLGRLWSSSRRYRHRLACFGATILCHAFERMGRIAARWFGIIPGRRRLLSLEVDVLPKTALIYRVLAGAENQRGVLVSYASARTLLQAKKSPGFQQALMASDICFLDGMGATGASWLLNWHRAGRVRLDEIIIELCRELANRGLSLAMVGESAEIVRHAGAIFSRSVPNLNISVMTDEDVSVAGEEVLKGTLAEHKPKVVLVGLGQPRQEQWAASIRPLLPGAAFLCVGSLFDKLVLAEQKQRSDISGRIGLKCVKGSVRTSGEKMRWYLLGIPELVGYVLAAEVAQICALFQRSARLARSDGSPTAIGLKPTASNPASSSQLTFVDPE
jgi:exopolysaccharide biosynthesis WecB/TagA/CpsF family protein